jgi:hypothetical protein
MKMEKEEKQAGDGGATSLDDETAQSHQQLSQNFL